MNTDIIKEYYRKKNTRPVILEKKLTIFKRNEDIANEFEYWIENGNFKVNGVIEQGYTAEKLASLSKYMNGEAAFILLMELRENPDKALATINEGFITK